MAPPTIKASPRSPPTTPPAIPPADVPPPLAAGEAEAEADDNDDDDADVNEGEVASAVEVAEEVKDADEGFRDKVGIFVFPAPAGSHISIL